MDLYLRRFLDDMNHSPVNVDRAYREFFKAEERAAMMWRRKWSWIIDEYRKIYKDLKALKENKENLDPFEIEEDDRTTRPGPETTGHEYGYLSTRPEFVLDKFKSPGLTHIPKSLTQRELYEALDERVTKRFGSTIRHGYLNYYKKASNHKEETNLDYSLSLF